MSQKNKVHNLFVILSVILLVILFLGIIARFMSFSEEQKTHLMYDNEVVANGSTLIITPDKEYQFNVNGMGEDYVVEFLPNVTSDNDFVYTVSGKPKYLSKEDNLVKGFSFVQEKTYFSLIVPKNLQKVIESIYPNDMVKLSSDIPDVPLFKVVVSNKDKTISTSFVFNICTVTNVSISPSEIVI